MFIFVYNMDRDLIIVLFVQSEFLYKRGITANISYCWVYDFLVGSLSSQDKHVSKHNKIWHNLVFNVRIPLRREGAECRNTNCKTNKNKLKIQLLLLGMPRHEKLKIIFQFWTVSQFVFLHSNPLPANRNFLHWTQNYVKSCCVYLHLYLAKTKNRLKKSYTQTARYIRCHASFK